MTLRRAVRVLALSALAAALLAALTLPRAHAAAVAVSWVPAAGATGYRIEVAKKAAGPWKRARDVAAIPPGFAYQAASIDGLRASGPVCVRVRTYVEGAGWSDASAPVCMTLPRPAVSFPGSTP